MNEKGSRLVLALTLVNLGLLMYQLFALRPAEAAAASPILRGRGLEIVDDEGRLRAQLKIEPANAGFPMPGGGKGYPETVIFRLVTADGKPRVKLTTSDEGSGLMLLGATDTTHTLLQADGSTTSLKLRNDEAVQQLLRP